MHYYVVTTHLLFFKVGFHQLGTEIQSLVREAILKFMVKLYLQVDSVQVKVIRQKSKALAFMSA